MTAIGPRVVIQELRLLCVAVQFLTRIPLPSFDGFETSWLDRSAKYFPLVGVLVGLITGGVLLAAAELWPQPIPALLAVGAGVLLTGAFHEDGLADTADGLGGGLTRDRRLEIMKDSRIGTYGVAALGLALALKVTCLAALPPAEGTAALVAAHAGARLMPLLMIRFAPYAGDAAAAKVKPLATGLTTSELTFAVIIAALALGPAFGSGFAMVVAALLALAAAGLVALVALRLIGGYTGDVLGAMEQVAEVAILLAASAQLGLILGDAA